MIFGRKNLRTGLMWAAVVLCAIAAHADEPPLHQRIDGLLEATATAAGLAAAPPADDAAFLRRVYLDLAGRIPSPAESCAFLADTAADKRQKLVDVLIAGPDYPRRMQELFHVLLMERLGDHAEWTRFLRGAFEKNLSWDQIVRALLAPNPDDAELRGAAFFLTKRLENYGQNPVDLPALTRDVGRLFLGLDLQCAQCHNHLFIDDYKQADFQGLFAFVGHTFIRGDVQFPAVGENLLQQKLEFTSVLTKEKQSIGPRLPGGTEVEIPTFNKGEEFSTPPDRSKNFPGIPKFSPLKTLAEQLARADNPQFAKNAANRLWFVMLGRGLVHPLDLQHGKNPPSHPELLDLLAREFAAHGCDIRWLLRELALTRAYQRSSQFAEGAQPPAPETFLLALERPLSAEQLLMSILEATGERPRWQPPAPLAAGAQPSPEEIKQREAETARMDELRKRFQSAFANPPREPEVEFAPSVKAALFLMHDATVLSWLAPQPGNLAERLLALTDAPALADELYLSVLSRPAADEERAAVAAYLMQEPDRPKAVRQLIWSLLASTEFCVNH